MERALSPSTDAGAATLRSSLLTAGNQLQWARIEEVIQQQRDGEREAREAREAATGATGAAVADGPGRAPPDGAEAESARGRLMSSAASSELLLDPALAASAAAAQAQQAAIR